MRRLRFRDTELAGIALLTAAAGLFVNDWVVAAAILVYWLGFKLLITGDRIPVLLLAFTFQWMQVTIGLFYYRVFGREVPTIYMSDYRPMVLIGLGCVLALAIGLRAGAALMRRRVFDLDPDNRRVGIVSWSVLITAYALTVVGESTLLQLSDAYPSLRQIFTTLTVVRLGMLFLVMRRLTYPTFRWMPFTLLLAFEVAMGFTGFFAGFREPLVLAVLALLEIFDHRRTAHLVSLAAMIAVMIAAAVMWMGVRDTYRRDFSQIDTFATSQGARMDRITSLGSRFFRQDGGAMLDTLDSLVDRLWVVYYPALAVARVPSVLPHTDGSILSAALIHVVTPRVFFPDKAPLPSDSEMVRKYAGVWVAGRDEGTTIAFGYAAESYVDFGVPMMFLPVAVFGFVMGMAYAWFVRTIWHRELAVATVTVVFWLSLYLFERSWAQTIGFAMSFIVYLGLPVVFVDAMVLRPQTERRMRSLARTPDLDALTETAPVGGDRFA
ncbi:MAG TPA: hypothetical protein VJP86_13070 [Vicinamibacterales bacterium]|nr:hypothetical protein [Vicinamibacterales bacterium]